MFTPFMFAKKNKKIVLLFCLFSVAFFLLPISFPGDLSFSHGDVLLTASADNTGSTGTNEYKAEWTSPTTWMINFLLMIQGFLAYFLDGAVSLLTKFIDATQVRSFLNNSILTDVWKAVRDVCNLAFILTLLFSAFATIFHVEKYHIKTIIVKLVLMALLINFSLPITRFITDTGNVPMYYMAQVLFGSSSTTNVGQQIEQQSNIVCAIVPYYDDCYQRTQISEAQYGTSQQDDSSVLFASIALLFLFTITMFVLAMLFCIRTVALGILIIFSPLGFIGVAVPALNKYSSEFWESLIKYTFFGPVMLFVLAVSVKLMSAMTAQALDNKLSTTGFTGIVSAIEAVATPIVILWMGMMIAQKANVAGAGAIIGMAQKVAKMPVNFAGKMAKGIPMSVGRFADRRLAKTGQRWSESGNRLVRGLGIGMRTLSPTATKNAFKAMGEKRDREAFGRASAGAEDLFTSIRDHTISAINPYAYWKGVQGAKGAGAGEKWKGFKKGLFYNVDRNDSLYEATEKEASDESKSLPMQKFDYVYNEFQNAMDRGQVPRVHGMLRAMTENNDLVNEFVLKHGAEFDGGNNEVSPENVRHVLDEAYKKAGVHDAEQRAKYIMTLGEIGTSKGNFALTGMTDVDKDGKFFTYGQDQRSKENQAKAAAGKLINMESQARARTMHPDIFFNYTMVPDPSDPTKEMKKFSGISEVGKEILKNLKGDDLQQMDRTRGDLKKIMEQYVTQISTSSNQADRDDFNALPKLQREYIVAMSHMSQGKQKGDAMTAATSSSTL